MYFISSECENLQVPVIQPKAFWHISAPSNTESVVPGNFRQIGIPGLPDFGK